MAMASDRRGNVDGDELRRQIRITILHELGHHHGMTESDLEELFFRLIGESEVEAADQRSAQPVSADHGEDRA